MATRASFLLVALAVVFVGCGNGEAGSSVDLENIQDRSNFDQASYFIGFQMVDQIWSRMDSIDVADLNLAILLAGTREALQRDSMRLAPTNVRRVMRAFEDSLGLRRLRRQAVDDTSAQAFLDEIATNTAATDSFFASLEGIEGLQTTESGLRYVVLQEGEGEPPAEGDIAQVNISASLMGGEEFRALSTPPDEPAPLVVGTFLVEGLNEALKGMAPGESRRLFIPPSLAFGFGGWGNPAPSDSSYAEVEYDDDLNAVPVEIVHYIPPATAIIIEVELTDVLDPVDTSDFGIGTAPPAIPQEATPAPQQ